MTTTTIAHDDVDESRSMEAHGTKLNGRVAFVTGGTRGIGAAISKSLVSQGATVAAGYGRNAEHAQRFLAELSSASDGAEVSVHQGDVASADDCQRTIREVIELHGRLDILINNAGITIDKTVAKMTEDEWTRSSESTCPGRSSLRRPRWPTCSSAAAGESSCFLGDRRDGRRRSGELRGFQGRVVRPDEDARPRGVFPDGALGKVGRRRHRRHGQCHHARLRVDRDGRSHSREGPRPHQGQHSHASACPAVGSRTSGALPGRRRLGLHHRTKSGESTAAWTCESVGCGPPSPDIHDINSRTSH